MNQDLIDNRHIRLFISSTFQDMKDERSYLMTQTFPLLRKLAAERPTPVFLPGKPHGQGSWWATDQRVTKSHITERTLHAHTLIFVVL